MSDPNKIFRIRDYELDKIIYVKSPPKVRAYILNNSKHADDILVEEITWRYKDELINLLNEAVDQGIAIGRFLDPKPETADAE